MISALTHGNILILQLEMKMKNPKKKRPGNDLL
jgi:hypothetical protein